MWNLQQFKYSLKSFVRFHNFAFQNDTKHRTRETDHMKIVVFLTFFQVNHDKETITSLENHEKTQKVIFPFLYLGTFKLKTKKV